MKCNLYLLVTDDIYELPLVVRSAICHSKNNNHCIYRKVTYEEQIDNTN